MSSPNLTANGDGSFGFAMVAATSVTPVLEPPSWKLPGTLVDLVFGVLLFNLGGSLLVEAGVRKWEYGRIWF